MKDPAFLFYSDNFLSGTMFFTDEQTGKYIRLLCAQHLTGHLKENHMIFICKSFDKDIWDKFTKDTNGLYYNERLELEIIKRRNYSESRSNNKKGKIKESKKTPKSYENHMGNENGNENINVFEEFRLLYQGTKRGKQTEFDEFCKKQKDWKEVLPILKSCLVTQIEQRKKLKESNKFVPEWQHLKTYLNQRSWELEFIFEDNRVQTKQKKIIPKGGW